MDSKYLIIPSSMLDELNMEYTHNELNMLRYNVARTQVLIEIPSTSPYYTLPSIKTKDEAREIINGEEWQHDPDVYGF